MTKDAANKEINKKLEAAYKLIRECEALADEHGTSFAFDVAYGMGGNYYGKKDTKKLKAQALAKLSPEEIEALGLEADGSNDSYDDDREGWQSSSSTC